LTAKAELNIFIHLWIKGEAEGTRNAVASETPSPLAAIFGSLYHRTLIHNSYIEDAKEGHRTVKPCAVGYGNIHD
jgi:hypothetical protein